MRAVDRAIGAFASWFSTPSSVWQTTAVVMAWVIVEASDGRLDPHGFVLLYVLTIYSAITQPALAYAANVSAQAATRSEDAQMQVLENQRASMEAILQMMEHMKELDKADARDLDEILAFVREVKAERKGADADARRVSQG